MNFVVPTKKGVIDPTLDFLVTSFQLTAHGLEYLPDWIRPHIPKPRFGLDFSEILRRRSLCETEPGSYTCGTRRFPPLAQVEESPKGQDFLGSLSHPLERVSAPSLATELAMLGIIPHHFGIYIKRIEKDDEPVYRLNIHWHRRPMESSEASYETVERCRELFTDLQRQFAWNVVGAEFQNRRQGYRCIVLDFRSRQPIVPSLRSGTIGIKDSRVIYVP